ncbi:MAG: NRDE family protein [Wenzhouxiangellaceae bacterium]
MCLIAWRFEPGAPVPLVLVANRDEFHARPTRALNWWGWPDDVLAGRDQQAGGTWLGVTRCGRIAAVTNFREPNAATAPCSRGELPLAWLNRACSGAEFADHVWQTRSRYRPFNLWFGTRDQLWVTGTHTPPRVVAPGFGALSNGPVDARWPKTCRAVEALRARLANHTVSIAALLDVLDDRCPADPADLPDTGIGPERERLLSAPFIVHPVYGTRSSSVVILGSDASFAERRFDPGGRTIAERHFRWRAAGDR